MLDFTDDEKEIMKDCLERGHNTWTEECLSKIKNKIKDYYIENQRHVCCYCSRNIYGEFRMSIDIEHILPKSKYLPFMFHMSNLAVSCKRCNINIKGSRVDFIGEKADIEKSPFVSTNYLFIHPNLDVYEDHLLYICKQRNRQIKVFYSVVDNSAKGHFTLNFFKLERLVIDSFDEAQGIDVESPEEKIDFMDEINYLEKRNQQNSTV